MMFFKLKAAVRGKKLNRYGEFYIDLGTTNTLIYTKLSGLQFNESTIMTVKQMSGKEPEYTAFGNVSKSNIGKMPECMSLLRPLREGVVTDFNSANKFLSYFMKKVTKVNLLEKSRLVISIPLHITQHERAVIKDLGDSLGARKVDLVCEPMAAAIGAGLDVLESCGNMVVDLGGGTTEAAVISLGGVVNSNARRIGGSNIDENIVEHLKATHHFVIGEQTAENLKMKVGSVQLSAKNASVDVGGIDLKTAMPRKLTITSEMIYQPINSFYCETLNLINKTFQECPPELAGDIAERGIVLVGGSALIPGFAERLTQDTGVKARLSDSPLLSVSLGGTKILNDSGLFEKLQFI